MDQMALVMTDTATLAVFDPALRREPLEGGADWWDLPLNEIPEVARGDMVMLSLGSDGVYQVRITDGELTAVERAYAAATIGGLGLRVASGKLVLGGGEALPDPDEPPGRVDPRCTVLAAPAGGFNVDAYRIDWRDSPRWWQEERETRDGTPPDVVLIVTPRRSPLPLLAREPQLHSTGGRSWVFPDEPREVGPVPGMLLTTTVRKGPKGLTLKECGPRWYTATFADYSQVQWKDRVRFRVTSVDHQTRSLVGEFVEKLPPDQG